MFAKGIQNNALISWESINASRHTHSPYLEKRKQRARDGVEGKHLPT